MAKNNKSTKKISKDEASNEFDLIIDFTPAHKEASINDKAIDLAIEDCMVREALKKDLSASKPSLLNRIKQGIKKWFNR